MKIRLKSFVAQSYMTTRYKNVVELSFSNKHMYFDKFYRFNDETKKIWTYKAQVKRNTWFKGLSYSQKEKKEKEEKQ